MTGEDKTEKTRQRQDKDKTRQDEKWPDKTREENCAGVCVNTEEKTRQDKTR